MHDWNHDGNDDYLDDLFYFENYDRSFLGEDDDEDDLYAGRSTHNTNSYNKSSSNGKWSIFEFIGFMVILAIIGYAIAAFGGELLGAIAVIILGIYIMNHF